MRRRILSLGQRAAVAAGPGRGAYDALARLLARYLRRGRPDLSVYLRGGLARGEVSGGLSDVDLLVVTPPGGGARRDEIHERWRRLGRTVPPLRRLAGAAVYEEDVFHDVAGEDALVSGLDRGAALYSGPRRPVPDDVGLSYRPGLHGPSEWRLLAGPDRRPPRWDPDAARRAAWMEVQVCWRYVFQALGRSDVSEMYRAYLFPKIAADLTRVWLSVVRGERAATRAAALAEAGATLEPGREALARVRALLDRPRGRADDVAEELLSLILRLTEQIAAGLAAAVAERGKEDVHLLGEAPGPDLPLADWRAVVVPSPQERVTPVDGDPSDPSALRRAFTATGTFRALRSGDLLVMPSEWTRGLLRAISFSATDPVTAALVEGRRVARFPGVPGWSARDWARRGVAEYRAWIESGGTPGLGPGQRLALLVSAARPALLLDSLERGEGELALTPRAAAERFSELDSAVGGPLVAACEGEAGIPAVEAALRRLPAYAASPAPAVAT